uniref:Putative secreted peptide n=1 Tax=Anopheles braziliensis TaxID=58242 RepID=A0A2M3ZNA2_9DIPT
MLWAFTAMCFCCVGSPHHGGQFFDLLSNRVRRNPISSVSRSEHHLRFYAVPKAYQLFGSFEWHTDTANGTSHHR